MDISNTRHGKAHRGNPVIRFWRMIKNNKFDLRLLWSFDWVLFLIIIAIAIFGIINIFAATAVPVDRPATSVLEMINTQPIAYARLQVFWLLGGLVSMALMVVVDYEIFGQYANVLYWVNIVLLIVVLTFSRSGRGGMSGWFYWGAESSRTIQPAEFGKLAIIVSLAKLFSIRTKAITRVAELIPMLAYVGLPLMLIVAQPDVGTAMVYVVIFGVMLFASGTSSKILIGIICVAVLMLVPIWYYMQNAEGGNFRADRVISFMNPDQDLLGANMQTYNARLAVGTGGWFGKGMFSQGSVASLNYIPDDYTDFIFAIVCETFGFVGAGTLVLGYLLVLLRLIIISRQAADAFGAYVVIGVMAMFLFHVVENIGMVIGLTPVTGIPLPLVSYGGSSFLTNMMGLGLAMNVAMRSQANKRKRMPTRTVVPLNDVR